MWIVEVVHMCKGDTDTGYQSAEPDLGIWFQVRDDNGLKGPQTPGWWNLDMLHRLVINLWTADPINNILSEPVHMVIPHHSKYDSIVLESYKNETIKQAYNAW